MPLTAFSGSLASLELIAAIAGHAAGTSAIRGALEAGLGRLGPACGARPVFDLLLGPLLEALGARASIVRDDRGLVAGLVLTNGRPAAICAAAGWNGDLNSLRQAAHSPKMPRLRWWIGTNGVTLRIVDVTRAYARRAIDVDLHGLALDEEAQRAVAGLFGPSGGEPLAGLSELVLNSDMHRAAVGRSLQEGVEEALGRLVAGFSTRRSRSVPLDAALSDALTVVYRILFLLFAEARGLVPQWHPIYRASYTIESLRPLAEGARPATGLWPSLQAIARLAHRGCTAGTLRVVPFNGRLFAPSAAPLAESLAIDDHVVRDVLLAVTTRPARDRRERISYADLGVEQLGSVYERVLEYVPRREHGGIAFAQSGQRKRTGTFYTPRAVTEYLVRRTLAPLLRGASPERILSLRVVDPSMGSGAFLVAACRYLADAYEEALIGEGSVTRADIGAADRAGFRRAVAQRCLYGVDVNPTAVQLARLSLWLCTLAADRPLTFLDHRLRSGNSLAGTTLADVARRPPGGSRREAVLPLFDVEDVFARVGSMVERRAGIARQPDDSAATVRAKERAIDELHGPDGPLVRWRQVADTWCAAWFWPEGEDPVAPRAWPALSAALHGRGSDLPRGLEQRWRTIATDVAAREQFFHWELEFPEVFYDASGAPRGDAGFDAVIGNPPWTAARALTRFSRDSGCYRLQGDGHANLYQLFAERMLALAARGGRIGMVMPSGLLADWGCDALRRHLFDRCRVDAAIGFDNSDGLFPIHRGVRFFLVTTDATGRTGHVPLRCGLRDPAALDDFPDTGALPGAVDVPMSLLSAFSGPGRGVPDLRAQEDADVLARILAAGPPLAAPDGWNLRFGRELNATDDRPHLGARGWPVLEGKHLDPFRARVEDAARFIDPRVAERLLAKRSPIHRVRLGYREVASSTNRVTLIAAPIPPRVVTTHTIFCQREPVGEADLWFLCGVFNSFVANYCIRLRGGTHVPAAAIHLLPVPAAGRGSRAFHAIASLARSIADGDAAARPRMQAAVAGLYGLSPEHFAHVLATFPLIETDERARALAALRERGRD